MMLPCVIPGTLNQLVDWGGVENAELIAKMRGRVAQCRSLAQSTSDPRTAKILNGMADEGEADIDRLLRENSPEDAAKFAS